jgi:predicted permease
MPVANVALSILLPLLAAMAVGYAWVRSGRPLDNNTLAPLAADLALPCLIFSALVAAELPLDTLVDCPIQRIP